MLKVLLQLVLICFVGSCAFDIDYKMPSNRFDTPETRGKVFSGRVEFNYNTASKITLLEVVEDRVFNLGGTVDQTVTIEKSGFLGARGELALLNRVDFNYKALNDSPNLYGLKVQIIGDPEVKKSSGFKLSVAGAYGTHTKNEGSLEIKHPWTSEVRTYDSELELEAIDYALILGYRIDDKIIPYLTLFQTLYKADAELKSNVHDNISIVGDSKETGALLGVMVTPKGSPISVKAEVGLVKGEWEDEVKLTSIPVGLSVGAYW